MNAASLLDELHSRGVTVEARGDRLRFRPANAVPPDLVEQLRANKGEVIALLENAPPRQVAAKKASGTMEPLQEIGAVRIRMAKFGSVWLALDQTTADELRAEEQQREHPRPVLMEEDVSHLENKSEEAIRAALKVIAAFPGSRIVH